MIILFFFITVFGLGSGIEKFGSKLGFSKSWIQFFPGWIRIRINSEPRSEILYLMATVGFRRGSHDSIYPYLHIVHYLSCLGKS